MYQNGTLYDPFATLYAKDKLLSSFFKFWISVACYLTYIVILDSTHFFSLSVQSKICWVSKHKKYSKFNIFYTLSSKIET
jgi:hypothetical protein